MSSNYKFNNISKRTAHNKGCKGFTLIEVAIAVLVIGLIMTPLLALYNVQYQQKMIGGSEGRLRDIASAINVYVEQNDRYPVPASFLTSEADPEHGMEGTTPDTCPDVTTNGFCLFDNSTPAPVTDDDVLIGAVPFSALKMESDLALDTWGNKILYAVARVQTDASTFDVNGSATITEQALDGTTNLPETEPLAHDVFLVSFGKEGKGAYSADGILLADCEEAGQPENEDENCDFDNVFLSDVNKNEVVTPYGLEDHGTRAFVDGTDEYYDDVTWKIQGPDVTRWAENINSPQFVTTIKKRIGIGEDSISPAHSLDVDGDVRVENDFITKNICTGTGKCFEPIEIYGSETDMNCDQNNIDGPEPVIAIGTTNDTAQVFCGSVMSASTGKPAIEQYSDTDGNNLWGSFEFTGVTFQNPVASETTNCTDSSKNLTSITGTGTGNIQCDTPF